MFLPWALIAAGFAILIISLVVYFLQPTPPHAQSVNITSAPSSVRPSAQSIADYTVAPYLPKYLTIPSLGIDNTRVIPLGLLNNNQIATPDNIYDVGWFKQSATPGQQGAMFIYGHISSWTAEGIFYNLHKLQPGAQVTIVRGDNTHFIYQVVSSKIYPYNKVDMKTVLAPVDPGIPGLNLMTCAGKVIAGTSEFNERLVMFTKLIKG